MVGYSGRSVSEAELVVYQPFVRLSPEMRARVKGLMEFCDSQGHPIGIGGTWRSSAQQEALFRSRYHIEDDTNLAGDTFWAGQYWEKNAGVAAAAPPGRSYHEPVEPDGSCLAVDLTGDTLFADQHCEKFGLVHFGNVNGEPWHMQPSEIPHARVNYSAAKHFPLKPWFGSAAQAAAATSVVAPAPVVPAVIYVPAPTQYLKLPINMTGPEVAKLQTQMQLFGWYPAGSKCDGWFGQVSERAVRAMQVALKIVADGVYGPKTAASFKVFLEAVALWKAAAA